MFPPRSSCCNLSDACLLDSFLRSLNCVSAAISGKIDYLEVMGILIDRLRFVSGHDALMQLSNSFYSQAPLFSGLRHVFSPSLENY